MQFSTDDLELPIKFGDKDDLFTKEPCSQPGAFPCAPPSECKGLALQIEMWPPPLHVQFYGEYIKESLGVESLADVQVVEIRGIPSSRLISQPSVGTCCFYDVNGDHLSRMAYRGVPCMVSVLGIPAVLLSVVRYVVKRSDFLELDKRLLALKIELPPKADCKDECLDRIYWTKETLPLKQDIMFFVKNYKWFKDRGLPYTRSYLLMGPPGNGKSLAVRNIAGYLNTTPAMWDFSEHRPAPDTDLKEWVRGDKDDSLFGSEHDDEEGQPEAKRPDLRLLVFEDLDWYFGRSKTREVNVTLPTILGCLDGFTKQNVVIIATANHPEDLDQQVLLRPGRFNRRIRFDAPTPDHALIFLERRFASDKVSHECLKEVVERTLGHSFAFYEDLFSSAASQIMPETEMIIRDDHVFAALDQQLSVLATEIKSSKRSPGFTKG